MVSAAEAVRSPFHPWGAMQTEDIQTLHDCPGISRELIPNFNQTEAQMDFKDKAIHIILEAVSGMSFREAEGVILKAHTLLSEGIYSIPLTVESQGHPEEGCESA